MSFEQVTNLLDDDYEIFRRARVQKVAGVDIIAANSDRSIQKLPQPFNTTCTPIPDHRIIAYYELNAPT